MTAAPPTRIRRASTFSIVVGILIVAIVLSTAIPVIRMLWSAFFPDGALDLSLLARTFSQPDLGQAALNTLIVVVVANAVALPVATFFAWLMERTDARMGILSTLLPVIPLLMPIVALTVGWFFLADPRSGFINAAIRGIVGVFGGDPAGVSIGLQGWPGMLLVYIFVIIPQMYVIIAASYQSMDPSLEEAARTAGGSGFRNFWRVSFPAVRHAIGAAALVGVITSVSLYSVPQVLGAQDNIQVLATYIYKLINGQYPPAIDQAVVLGVSMLAVVLAIWLGQQRLAGRSRHAQVGGQGVRSSRIRLGGWKWPARILVLVYVLCTSILPLLSLLIVAFQPFWTPNIDVTKLTVANFTTFFGDGVSRISLLNSVILGLTVATGTVVVGALFAAFNRLRPGWLARVAAVVTKLPAALPHIAFAVGVLILFGFAPFNLRGTLAILFICYIIEFLPTTSIAAETAVNQVGKQLSDASLMSGAGPARTLGRVILPLALPGMAAGWALVFTIIVGELNSAAILAGPTNTVVGYRILTIFESGTYAQLAALGVIIVAISMISTFSVLIFARPRYASRKRRGGRPAPGLSGAIGTMTTQ